ncbi:ATP-binding cassette domain-containing protein [Paraburkholderia sp.]|uniref:ATP-binding cassette domain-containing protein n=1 Tax=Paraburkholderia sp. TaxID=1926495 RepID=UPI003D6E5DF6
MRTEDPVLSVDGVTLSTTIGRQSVAVLRDLRIDLRRGRMLGVVGESGTGKSMLARLISGLLPPGFEVTNRQMRFTGRDMLAMSSREHRDMLGRQIAFVPQKPLTALNPLWTIGATFTEHLKRLGVPAREHADIARRYLESVHLPAPSEMLYRYPHQLSGGQCQRVLACQ